MVNTVVDVSNNNPEVDWKRVKLAGVTGAYIKLTEGVTYNDPLAATHAAGAGRQKIPYGFYHYARPDHNNPDAEVKHIAKLLPKLRPQLRLALDLEDGVPVAGYGRWAHQFSQLCKEWLGHYPVFYSYPDYIERLRLQAPVGDGLWLASYGRNDGVEHPYVVPAPWKRAVMHQFSSECKVAGIVGFVDLSHAASLKPLRITQPAV